MHKGATFHAFILFPTKDPSQLKRASLLEASITYYTPNNDKTSRHKLLVLVQESNRWSADSSLFLHKKYSSRFNISFSIVWWEGSCPKSLPRKIPLLLVPLGSNNIIWKERSYLLNIKYEYRDFAKSITILSP